VDQQDLYLEYPWFSRDFGRHGNRTDGRSFTYCNLWSSQEVRFTLSYHFDSLFELPLLSLFDQ
jgi:hypothetical protein